MRFSKRCAAVCALCLLLTALTACRPILDPNYRPAEPAASAAPEAGLSGVWVGQYDAGDLLTDELGLDLSAYLRGPVPALLRLELDEAGRCVCRSDYSSCAEVLHPALAAFLKDLWAQEGEPAPGADPETCAAALIDELTPPPYLVTGVLSPDGQEIRWDLGTVSPLAASSGQLSLELPELGRFDLVREDGA